MARYIYPKSMDTFGNGSKNLEGAYPNEFNNQIVFSFYERTGFGSSAITDNVFLYMPQNVESPISVSWDQAGVGAAGNIGAGPGLLSWEGLKSLGSSGASGVWRNLERMGYQAAEIGTSINGEDAVSFVTQTASNEFMKMLFRNVNFRTYEYTFKFTPKTIDESDEIINIINTFRKGALPPSDPNNAKFVGYPYEVTIDYIQGDGEQNKWLPKFKPCVITDLHVNYSSAGHFAAMRNGFPAETELRITLSENELLYRDSIDEGF